MTPRQFTKTLTLLGLTQMGFARAIKRNETTVRDWAGGRSVVPTEIAMLLNLMLETGTKLEDLKS